MAYTLNDILTTVAYLLGERSVNSTTTASRTDFVQSSLQEAYKAYPWRFARSLATIIFTNGIATLPTNYDIAHKTHIKFDNGSEVTLDEISDDDTELYEDGDRAVWIESIGNDGTDEQYVLHTKDSDVAAASFKYQRKAPTLDTGGTVKTQYPSKMTIALGARRYVKLGQNPDADISQDQALFEKNVANDVATHQVQEPRKKRRSIRHSTGEF